MRFGFVVLFTGSDSTVDVLRMVSEGCGISTMNVPRRKSVTPSTPSSAVTLTFQVPSTGDAGTVYWYWKMQLAAVCELQVAGAPCAVIAAFGTTVAPAGSVIVMRAPLMSKLPNGSLTCARMNTFAPG